MTDLPGQKALDDLTAMHGAPKLAWRAGKHPNDYAITSDYQISLCGNYARYSSPCGKFYVGRYLHDCVGPGSIGIEKDDRHGKGAAKRDAWIERHHQARCRLALAEKSSV